MKNSFRILFAGVLICLVSIAWAFRPPAVPLVSCDPFFSVWSAADRLTDAETSHWTGVPQPVSVLLTADGRTWRLCGRQPANVPALPQTGLAVRATQTVYTFQQGTLAVTLTWSTAKLTDDLDVFSRPVTYVTARVSGAKDWSLTASISPELATNDSRAPMTTNRCEIAGLPAMRIGRTKQKPLSESGDRVRCNWGWAWLVGPGRVSADEAQFLLAYDDVASIDFFGERLPAWWRRDGLTFEAMLGRALSERASILARLDAFDAEFAVDMEKIGGAKYADLVALAYRQTFAACKLAADRNNQPLYFSKENNSNGCIGTVDVLYPQSPQMLLVSPTLLRAMLAPVLVYAAHPRWPWPFAPHDLGRFPLATQQRYAGGEKGRDPTCLMPVEECGNMIIALAALAHIEGTAEFASGWWPTVTKWVEYLEKFGFDPGNQLCTDDFAGRLAHNANLAAKSIVAFACYGRLAEMRGEADVAKKYQTLAKDLVPKWQAAAKEGRAGGYRLAYDRADTWSMKYNIAWDRVLGLGLFPADVAEAEWKVYPTVVGKYGIPLDNRKAWTKADWMIWVATLRGRRADVEWVSNYVWKFANETPDRVPLSDWYWTDSGKHQHFTARSVIGGLFMPALTDAAIWKKYAARDKAKTHLYAPLKAATAKGDESFRLATFNIRCPADKGEIAWSNRLPRVLSIIRNRQFDILGIQEGMPAQRKDLDAGLGTGWARVGLGRLKDDQGEAMCIYYRKDRFECLGTDTFWLSETPRVPGSRSWDTACSRCCTWGLFKDLKTGKTFRYFNTHLDHISAHARVMGMKVLLKEMECIAQGETVFLTGDMNDMFERLSKKEQARLRAHCGPQISEKVTVEHPIYTAMQVLRDSLFCTETPHQGPSVTFTGYQKTPNTGRIDYVFVSGNVRVLEHATFDDMPEGKFPSDHWPVGVRVQIR